MAAPAEVIAEADRADQLWVTNLQARNSVNCRFRSSAHVTPVVASVIPRAMMQRQRIDREVCFMAAPILRNWGRATWSCTRPNSCCGHRLCPTDDGPKPHGPDGR